MMVDQQTMCSTHPFNPTDVFMGCTACHFEATQMEDAERNERKCAVITTQINELHATADALGLRAYALKDDGAPEIVFTTLMEGVECQRAAARRLTTWRSLIMSQVKR